MSTRHVEAGESRRQDGLASDPIYAAALGIQGTIATKKASILTNARARSLVFFLQALSLPVLAGRLNPGGLKRWSREFLAAFRERLGSPSMHKFGMKPGQEYNAEQVRAVRGEFPAGPPWRRDEEFPVTGDTIEVYAVDDLSIREPARGTRSSYPAEVFRKKCLEMAATRLENFLIGLCSDPNLLIVAPGEDEDSAALNSDELSQVWPEADHTNYVPQKAKVCWFRDILGALFEFQQRFAEQQARSFVMTSIARQVFDSLDAGLRLRRIALVNGLEGIGKSEAARAWCAQHLGEARYIDLTGINSKTNFFRALARALGLPSSASLNSIQLQGRIEPMLQRSGLMLVIDEAHYLLPQSDRSRSTPELINWIDTALINRGVPAGLVTTPQFGVSMKRVEDNSGWNSGQFARRIVRTTQLPARPELTDLEAIAAALLPKAQPSVIKLIVG